VVVIGGVGIGGVGIGALETVPLVLVVGDVMNDVIVRPRSAFAVDTDTASEIEWSPGGSGANQAAWLGYLCGRARFVGRTGISDALAHVEALERFGVDAHISADALLRTGTVVVVVSGDGERSMYTDRGANIALSRRDLDASLLSGVSLLHISGYAFFEEESRVAALSLISVASTAGIPVSIDPASVAGLVNVGVASFCEWTAGSELIFPNLDEGRFISRREDPDEIVSALVELYRVVALKLGRDGCIVATRNGDLLRLPVESEGIDSTGAGDAFCAGFLAEWVKGTDTGGCAGAAMAAARVAVSGVGARPRVAALGG
jgi:sugar/nucleoside kinase (ribokinase family)